MTKSSIKTYLMIPLSLTLFLASSTVLADEVTSTQSVTESTSESKTSSTSAATEIKTSQSSATTVTSATTEADTGVSEMTQSQTSSQSATSSTASQTSTESLASTSSGLNQSTSSNSALTPRTLRSAVTTSSSQPVTSTSLDSGGIRIQYNGDLAANEKIQFAVWSELDDQNDLRWYTANNLGTAYAEFKNHRTYGKYFVHTYANRNGKMVGLNASSIIVANPQVKTTIQKTSDTSFDVLISNVPETVTNLVVPVWSQKNNQDDIVWYKAVQTGTSSYKVSVDTKNHRSDLGHYEAHIYGYSKVTQSQIGLAASSGFDAVDSRPNALVSIGNYKENSKTFDVNVVGSSATKTITGVSIAVWSEENGQDDLKWYAPQISNNQASAKIDIANHSNTFGNYIIHVYTDYSDSTKVGTNLGTYKFSPYSVSADQTAQGISLKFDSVLSFDKTQIRFAVWSANKDQDDLKWYSADSKGEAIAPYTNHSGYGTYYIHTYQSKDGKMIPLNGKTLTIAQPELKTAISKTGDNTYLLNMTNVPLYISEVLVPVWTDNKGQDDIRWYGATKVGDTAYQVTIQAKNHQFETGHYSVHVYGKSQLEGNRTIGLATTAGFNVTSVKVANPSVQVTNHNPSQGTLDVVVSESADTKAIKTVKVAVWSESNQSNLYWYETSTVVNGKATIAVNQINHKGIVGNYTIHVYTTTQDNQESGYNAGTYRLESKTLQTLPAYFIDISSHNGNITVEEFNRLKQQGIVGVVVKLTEGTSYINPFAKAQIANAQAAGIKVSAYHYSHYTSASEAQAEAQYFVRAAKNHGLSSATVMVNDMEESKMLSNINSNVQAWQDEMKRLGYGNVVHYTMASWLDIRGGQVSTSQFGIRNFWIAHYVNGYTYLDQASAKAYAYYNNAAAWQYTSVSKKLTNNLDENIDYTGRFTI
ncbi:GBS Bsp-like repeat-containing protein [Streptococcus ferus]|uniref:GBS Bsp-like repeat-containing protein n=1 Tax=Streptococcus ferus TaxID=1345 RepID=UPI0035A0602F